MNLEIQAALSYYEKIADLNAAGTVSIVMHRESKRIFVEKTPAVFCADVYEALRRNPVPDMPRILQVLRDEEKLYVIEEYVSGETLDKILAREHKFSENKTISYILALCKPLSTLHSFYPPIIHRDLKPENIMIRFDGSVCLLDLDAAKQQDLSKTRDTQLIGTQGYAAPEQYGFYASDARTDIYALGKLMNTMLTGQEDGPWYEGDVNLRQAPSKNRFLKKDSGAQKPCLAEIIRKAAAFSPVDRYQSVYELVMDLGKLKQEIKEENPFLPERKSYVIPGFRTKNLLHMLIACCGYTSIIGLGISLEIEGADAIAILVDRIIYLLCMLFAVAVDCDYLGLRILCPWHDNPYPLIRIFGIILIDVIIFVLMIIVFVFVGQIV